MTPSEVITTALARTGLSATSTLFVDRARTYLNVTLKDIAGMATWRWLYKVGTLTTASGTREYQLATDVLYPRAFRDTTNDRPLTMRHPEWVDDLDPDDDNTDSVRVAAVTGRDSSGAWNVDIIGTPQATTTLKYRYYAFIADLTSSNDDTELVTLNIPEWVQPALIWGTTALYMEQEQNESAGDEWAKYTETMRKAQEINGGLSSDIRTRMSRSGDLSIRDPYTPAEGSLA